MTIKNKTLIWFFLVLLTVVESKVATSQEVINLANPSFEGRERQGESIFFLDGWVNAKTKTEETVPDIHSIKTGYFDVRQAPMHGKTYLGMVVRENETNEAVSQKLVKPLSSNSCYKLGMFLCKNPSYKSRIKSDTTGKKSFTTPAKLIIWGGYNYGDKAQKLGETETIKNLFWKEYNFDLQPKEAYTHITLEAYWKTPSLIPYNGNILLDHMSPLVEYNCDENLPVASAFAMTAETNVSNTGTGTKSKPTDGKTETKSPDKPETEKIKTISGVSVSEFISSKKQLSIRDLTFEADSFLVQPQSFPSLDEIFFFLRQNSDVHLEIAGHTNNKPADHVCDELSLKRAQAVKEYLTEKGIDPNRLKTKGFGKRKPLVSNKTAVGRARNQRVEIKVISS